MWIIIVTGDLGKIGYEICKRQLLEQGYDVNGKYYDCGMQIYHEEDQDVHAEEAAAAVLLW